MGQFATTIKSCHWCIFFFFYCFGNVFKHFPIHINGVWRTEAISRFIYFIEKSLHAENHFRDENTKVGVIIVCLSSMRRVHYTNIGEYSSPDGVHSVDIIIKWDILPPVREYIGYFFSPLLSTVDMLHGDGREQY